MNTMTIVWIVLAVFLIILIFKILKKLVSVALSAAGIIIVVWLVIIGLQYADKGSLRENLLTSNNLVLLNDGNQLTGFATKSDGIEEEIDLSDKALYDKYFKVIIVDKEAFPEKIGLVYDVSEEHERQLLFQNFVENNLLNEDATDNLLEYEKLGLIEVYRNTIAFKQGFMEVLGFE